MINSVDDPVIELKAPLCSVGRSSPIIKNGTDPNPNEKPAMKSIKLAIGSSLKLKIVL